MVKLLGRLPHVTISVTIRPYMFWNWLHVGYAYDDRLIPFVLALTVVEMWQLLVHWLVFPISVARCMPVYVFASTAFEACGELGMPNDMVTLRTCLDPSMLPV